MTKLFRSLSNWSALGLFLAVACTNENNSYMLNGNPISFIANLQDIKVSFMTSVPNKKIELVFTRDSETRVPTLYDVLGFLRKNEGYLARYIIDDYDCKQFAYKLFQDARKEKLRANFVILALKDQNVGHAIVAIDTRDAGRLFVDFTPLVAPDGTQRPSRRIVWVSEGDPYIRIPLESLPKDFQNKKANFYDWMHLQKEVEQQANVYNRAYDKLDARKDELQARINAFNDTVNRGVASGDMRDLKRDQEKIDSDVKALNADLDILRQQENTLRATVYDFEWVGKDWIIHSFKTLP